MKRLSSLGFAALAASLLIFPKSTFASFHEWLPSQIFSNSTGTIQFIEFSDMFDFEYLLTSTTLTSNTSSYPFPSNLPDFNTANKHFLVGTAAFAALPGAPTPDYTIPDHFFSTSGDEIYLQFTVQPHLIFSSGDLPLDGRHALFFDGLSLSTGINSPTNFNGDSGSVTIPEPASLSVLAATVPLFLRRRRAREVLHFA